MGMLVGLCNTRFTGYERDCCSAAKKRSEPNLVSAESGLHSLLPKKMGASLGSLDLMQMHETLTPPIRRRAGENATVGLSTTARGLYKDTGRQIMTIMFQLPGGEF
ncbi:MULTISPECIES: hypothetical protein [unclassified Sulfitobacter]|uniref:hypothetical protein n=1 Tax=unclassified Sulfitobacter TaxID=196795 RepID=UPI001EF01E13|nr:MULTISPECIES: hypothetical protein [unclassified Sulfitobacter]